MAAHAIAALRAAYISLCAATCFPSFALLEFGLENADAHQVAGSVAPTQWSWVFDVCEALEDLDTVRPRYQAPCPHKRRVVKGEFRVA